MQDCNFKGCPSTEHLKCYIKYLDNYRGEKCSYAHQGDSGFDLRAAISSDIILKPMSFTKVPSGVAVKLPEACELQVRPKSGLSSKGILAILGSVDNGYQGEIQVVMYNLSDDEYVIHPGSKIAQAVINKLPAITLSDVIDEKDFYTTDSTRKADGFGSTGEF